MSPASWLQVRVIVVVTAVLPFAIVGIVAASLAAADARATLRSEAIGRARTTVSAIDGELQGHIRTVEALAMSSSIHKGDVRGFHEQTRRVLTSQPRWLNVGLQSATGVQLFNAVAPFGSPAPPQVDQDSLERALERGTPQIGNVAVGPAIEQPATRVRVPVIADGKVRYVISVPLKPQVFEDILRRQPLRENWSIALVDANRRLIASVPPLAPGTVFAEHGKDARSRTARQDREGFTHVVRGDGAEIYSGYVTSGLSGWTVSVSLAQDALETAAWDATRPIVIGLVVALALLALTLAFLGRPSG